MCSITLGVGNRAHAQASATPALSKSLQDVYLYWRSAMIKKNHNAWQQITASHRKLAIQNRIMSEKAVWPGSIYELPTAPPSLTGLKLVRARTKGVTAKLVFFGKIDFGVGGSPTENLLVLSFVHEGRGWKYDTAEFVNLGSLKDIRKQIQSGDLSYVDGAAFLPDGKRPPQPIIVKRAKYIAKVYAYCPGREVQVSVNRISKHRFQDTQQAEIVIGGAKDGRNELWFSIKDLPGYKGKDPLTVRVYLFSQINNVKPVKVFQYQIAKGQVPKPSLSTSFTVDAAAGRKVLTGR
ncbi:MAG: hypothetical protein AB8F34_16775 [Akkermansiaceae bacterium]